MLRWVLCPCLKDGSSFGCQDLGNDEGWSHLVHPEPSSTLQARMLARLGFVLSCLGVWGRLVSPQMRHREWEAVIQGLKYPGILGRDWESPGLGLYWGRRSLLKPGQFSELKGLKQQPQPEFRMQPCPCNEGSRSRYKPAVCGSGSGSEDGRGEW